MAPLTSTGSRASSILASALPLSVRSSSDPPPSPMELGDLLRPRAPAGPDKFQPSKATVDPKSINNNGIFALFGLLGAGMVLASIWFFFWAKNGGFRFRKGDWAEYKSTVLRRKGPNGTTLTGATPSTRLGGGSVVGSQGSLSDLPPGASAPAMSEKSHGRRNPLKAAKAAADRRRAGRARKKTKPGDDEDVRAYRREKSAKVGGFNRSPDGWFHDLSAAGSASHPSPSDAGVRAVPPPMAQQQQPRTPRARQFSYQHGSEVAFSVASDDSHRPLRASPGTASPASTPRHSRQPSPTKRASGGPAAAGGGQRSSRHSGRGSMPGSYVDPLDFESRYQDSVGDDSRGTKSYYHPIPGLGRNAGPAGGPAGFRRGGGGRRDSLSDSGGETGTYRS